MKDKKDIEWVNIEESLLWKWWNAYVKSIYVDIYNDCKLPKEFFNKDKK